MKSISQLTVFIASMIFFLVSCKKDHQDLAPPATPPPRLLHVKVDTTFEFTAISQRPFSPLIIEKTVYIPALDSIKYPDLSVYRTFLYPKSGSQEIQLFRSFDQSFPYYTRREGRITYTELVIGDYDSVKLDLHIVGAW